MGRTLCWEQSSRFEGFQLGAPGASATISRKRQHTLSIPGGDPVVTSISATGSDGKGWLAGDQVSDESEEGETKPANQTGVADDVCPAVCSQEGETQMVEATRVFSAILGFGLLPPAFMGRPADLPLTWYSYNSPPPQPPAQITHPAGRGQRRQPRRETPGLAEQAPPTMTLVACVPFPSHAGHHFTAKPKLLPSTSAGPAGSQKGTEGS